MVSGGVYCGTVTDVAPLEAVPYACVIVLLGAAGLVALVLGALVVGLTKRRRTGWLLVTFGTIAVAAAFLGALVAAWLIPVVP